MRASEWSEIVKWMVPRWPQMATWEDEMWPPYWDDLHPYAADDVQEMVVRLHRNGVEFPPRSGAILKMLRDFDRRPERALPPPTNSGPVVSWEEAAEALGVPGMSFAEYAQMQTEDREPVAVSAGG